MSTTPVTGPVFTASKTDPSRAAEVSEREYAQLVTNLEKIVMPCLSAAAVALRDGGFSVVKLERRAGLASLVVWHHRVKVDGWLYFQIHRSFAPLISGDRIFWMFAIHREGRQTQGEPGRLPDLENAGEVRGITEMFTSACLTAKQRETVPAN